MLPYLNILCLSSEEQYYTENTINLSMNSIIVHNSLKIDNHR